MTLFFDPNIPAAVEGDPLRIRQVLTNLVSNAIKFSAGLKHRGQVSIRATLVAQIENRAEVEIIVADNGIGMGKEVQERLFQSFEQADTSTTKRFGGTGLGLSIANSLVEMMHGGISVHSEPGKGSVFSVRLPFVVGPVKKEKAASPVAGLNCAVVDFEGSLGDDYETYLKDAGAQVCRSSDLELAYENLCSNYPEPYCFVVVGEPSTVSAMDKVRELTHHHADHQINVILVSYLSVERGRRRSLRALENNVFQIDRESLTRRGFLKAVSIAAGREPLETFENKHQRRSMEGDHLLPRREVVDQGRLILVSEDNVANQDVIERQLGLLGLRADITSNGKEAFERWQSGDYGLILTDLHMPEMDGYDLTVAIRDKEQAEGLKRTPIVALTANALKHEAQHCLSLGMDAYITKPVPLDDLEEVLLTWLPGNTGKPSAQSAPSGRDRSEMISESESETETETETEEEKPAIDPDMLSRIIGNHPEMQQRMLDKALTSISAGLTELEGYFDAQETTSYADLCHKLKSISRSIGANRLGDILEALERAGKAGVWDTIQKRDKDIRPAFEEVRSFYRKGIVNAGQN